MGLILDTTEFIRAERNRLTVSELLVRSGAHLEQGVSVITLAELKHGVRRADTPQRAAVRQRFLDDVLNIFTILDITAGIAMVAGDLEAHLQMQGDMLPINDLLIAATALQYRHSVLTRNVDHFKRIPGLQVLDSR